MDTAGARDLVLQSVSLNTAACSSSGRSTNRSAVAAGDTAAPLPVAALLCREAAAARSRHGIQLVAVFKSVQDHTTQCHSRSVTWRCSQARK